MPDIRGLTTATNRNDRFFRQIRETVSRTWGGRETRLGETFFAAVLSAELVSVLTLQDDEDVTAERVRELLVAGEQWIRDETDRTFT